MRGVPQPSGSPLIPSYVKEILKAKKNRGFQGKELACGSFLNLILIDVLTPVPTSKNYFYVYILD